jgi:hypothetical protein
MANLILWNTLNNTNDSPMTTLGTSAGAIRPAGVHQLASWLRQHGYTVKVIDFCHIMPTETLAELTEKYIDSTTIAIGASSIFWEKISARAWTPYEAKWVVAAREIVERRHPNVKWILGGYNIEAPSIKMNWVKFVGYAEDSLLKWMDENSGKYLRRDLFDIQTLRFNFVEDDLIRPEEALPMELGRGCQFKCSFCSYPLIGKKKGTYLRGFDIIREEFIRNYNEWGTTWYYFLDDTMNESEEKVQALADIVQGLPFELKWTGYNRADLIWSKPETSQWLRDSGLKSCTFGIESFHPKASMSVGKGWSGKHGKEFLLELKEKWGSEITWHLAFIAGLPGESIDDVKASYQWCIENKMYNWAIRPLSINRTPTKLWKSVFDTEYEKYGYRFPEGDLYNWENDLTTHKEVYSFTTEMNRRSIQHCTLGNWLLTDLAGLGYNYRDINTVILKDLPWREFYSRTINIVNGYTKTLLER